MDDAIFATLSDQVSQQTEVIICMHDDAILPGNYSSNDAIFQPSHQMTWLKCTVINVFFIFVNEKRRLKERI